MAFVALATIAMVGCKPKNEPTKPVNPEDDPEEEIVIPDIAKPGAGKVTIAIHVPEGTCQGAYLVGNFQSNNIKDLSNKFAEVENAENWLAVTIDYASDLAVKAIAIPAKEEYIGWSYQWGMNIDENDEHCTVTEDHTFIVGDEGEFAFENGGEVKLTNISDGGVAFVNVKAWKAEPCPKEGTKLLTAWMKSGWNGASTWTWKQMTNVADNTFELRARCGDLRANLAETENGADIYYESIEVVGEDTPVKGDSVLFKFVSEDGLHGKLTAELIEKAEPKPAKDPIVMKVVVKYPADWTNANPTAWVWATGDGVSADLVVESETEHTYSYTTPEPVSELNIIFRNGNDWGMGQTENVEGIYAAEIHYAIAEEGTGNRAVTVVE